MIFNSPIRQLINSEKELPANLLKKDFTRIKKDSLTLIENMEKPLKLVIMGEVKAGKSTFINALACGDISPVEVTETTASVIEIYYSKEEKGIINKKNKVNIEGSIDDIYQILEKNKNNIEYFSNVDNVELGYSLPNLKKLHIIDTPGLASLTKENEKKTVDFVQSSDVILWVFNGNHLGQSDVSNKLSNVAKLGKPVIGIINRVDEVDSTPKRLKMYMKKNYGAYLEEVFTLSAYNAYKGQLENNEELINNSGYYDVLDHLENNIERNSKEVHKKSITSSARSLIEQDLALHESYSRNIVFIKQQIEKHKEEIEYNNKRIKYKFKNLLKSWAKNELLKDEEEELLNMIDELSFTSRNKDKKIIKNKMEKYFSNKNIKKQIIKKIKSLSEDFEEQWQSTIFDVQKKMQNDIEEFVEKENDFLSENIKNFDDVGIEIFKEIGKGAAIAGSAGLTYAAYASWFGPAAATYTIGTTISFTMMPLLIGGAIAGGFVKLISNKNEKEKLRKSLKKQIEKIRKEKILGEIVPRIYDKIIKRSNEVADNINKEFVNEITGNWEEEEINSFNNKIDNYCTRIKTIKNIEIEF